MEALREQNLRAPSGPAPRLLSNGRHRWRDSASITREQLRLAELLAELGAVGASPRRGMALEYRCGAGRMCRALGEVFGYVWGVDSEAMLLDRARELNCMPHRIFFKRMLAGELPASAHGLDFNLATSGFTLLSQEGMQALLGRLVSSLAPGGIGVYDFPARQIRAPRVEAALNSTCRGFGAEIVDVKEIQVEGDVPVRRAVLRRTEKL